MHIVLLILYLILFSFLASRSGFLIRSGLSFRFLVGIFLFYVLAGCAHVWIAYHFYPYHGDIWTMFADSLKMKHDLLYDLPTFKKDFFPDSMTADLAGTRSGWSYFQNQALVVIHTLLNFLSFDHLYINTVFFCFLTLWGRVALFRMLSEMFPGKEGLHVIISFCIPSIVFWTSPLHKDGILFSCLGILFYCLYRIIRREASQKHIILLILSLIIIFLIRKIILVTLVPSVAIWWLAERTRWKKRYILLYVSGVTAGGLALMAWADPSWNILIQLSERQQDFQLLEGGSRIELPLLHPDWKSFLSVLPYAFINGWFMPLPGSGGKTIYNLFSLELITIWVVIGYCVYTSVKNRTWSRDNQGASRNGADKHVAHKTRFNGFMICCLIFSLSGFLIIGYTVPFIGALIRYRSIFYTFLLIPFIQGIDGIRWMKELNRHIKKWACIQNGSIFKRIQD